MADREPPGADRDVPSSATADTTRDIAPLIRVTKGDPTDEEVAALVAVVSSLGAAAEETSGAVRRSEWSAHHRKVRGPHVHGPGAWRTTAFPR
jgi:hypothetical protein